MAVCFKGLGFFRVKSLYICTYVGMYVCMYVCMYVYMYVSPQMTVRSNAGFNVLISN